MKVHLLLYRGEHKGHQLAWGLRVKSLKQAEQAIPALIRRHLEAHPQCPGFTHYTVSGARPGDGRWRILSAGEIRSGETTHRTASANHVAR